VFFIDRTVEKVLDRKIVIEGVGVRLKRVIGNKKTLILDSFLLLDHFISDDPKDYIIEFSWHPHRGMETVTYMWIG
jgi:redox-sensitive bicupin YhaK (pirin superfamily)